MTTKKPYLVPLSERIRRAHESLDFAGQSVSAKGGQARAAAYAERNKAIFSKYKTMIDAGKQHSVVVNFLSKKHKLTPGSIRRILKNEK